MNILALPDVFLRKVMRTVEIKDRLRLRLTCRAFEQLVAETNAGYFENAFVSSWMPDRFTMTIGDALLYGIEWSEEGMANRLHLRNRLFNGISIEEFDFNIDDDPVALEFIRRFLERFKIGALGFRVQSEQQLENARKLMSDFPNSKYTMDLCILPSIENVLVLPPMEELNIFVRTEISSDLCIKLIGIHKNLDLGESSMSSEDLRKMAQIVSKDPRQRKIRLKLKSSNVVNCMREFGISEASRTGDICDQASFEIILVKNIHKRLHLRYERCLIEFTRFAWKNSESNVDVLLSTVGE